MSAKPTLREQTPDISTSQAAATSNRQPTRPARRNNAPVVIWHILWSTKHDRVVVTGEPHSPPPVARLASLASEQTPAGQDGSSRLRACYGAKQQTANTEYSVLVSAGSNSTYYSKVLGRGGATAEIASNARVCCRERALTTRTLAICLAAGRVASCCAFVALSLSATSLPPYHDDSISLREPLCAPKPLPTVRSLGNNVWTLRTFAQHRTAAFLFGGRAQALLVIFRRGYHRRRNPGTAWIWTRRGQR